MEHEEVNRIDPDNFNAKDAVRNRQTTVGPQNEQLYTYKRKNAVGTYDTRQVNASDGEKLKAEGWVRADEITGREEDATVKPSDSTQTVTR